MFQASFIGIVWCDNMLNSKCVCCVFWSKAAVASTCPQSARNPSDPSHIWFWISFGSLHFQTFLLLPVLFVTPTFSYVTPPHMELQLSLRSWGVDKAGQIREVRRLCLCPGFLYGKFLLGSDAVMQPLVWKFPLQEAWLGREPGRIGPETVSYWYCMVWQLVRDEMRKVWWGNWWKYDSAF